MKMLYMRSLSKFILIAVAAIMVLGLWSCSKVDEPDYREAVYGYVQFKVYKVLEESQL